MGRLEFTLFYPKQIQPVYCYASQLADLAAWPRGSSFGHIVSAHIAKCTILCKLRIMHTLKCAYFEVCFKTCILSSLWTLNHVGFKVYRLWIMCSSKYAYLECAYFEGWMIWVDVFPVGDKVCWVMSSLKWTERQCHEGTDVSKEQIYTKLWRSSQWVQYTALWWIRLAGQFTEDSRGKGTRSNLSGGIAVFGTPWTHCSIAILVLTAKAVTNL